MGRPCFCGIEVAESGKTVCGICGRDRAMLYLMAGYSGLRASELASLTWESVDFRTDPPVVTIEAAYSKRRRKDVLPLHPDLALRLREWLAEGDRAKDDDSIVLSIDNVSDDKPKCLWPGRWAVNRHAAEMLRSDLQAAEIAYEDESGKVFDFHALRHQFISMLAQSGVHPKTAQELARHSTITLTMDHYTHIGLHDLSAALESLPGLPTTESQAIRATGTEGVKNVVAGLVAGADDISSNSVRAIETGGHSETDSRGDSGGNQEPLQTVGFESDCDRVSCNKKKVREGGLEPPIPVGNQILNLARLPIPPLSLYPPILVVSAQPLKPLDPHLQLHTRLRLLRSRPAVDTTGIDSQNCLPSATWFVSTRHGPFSPFIPQGSPWLPATTQPVS